MVDQDRAVVPANKQSLLLLARAQGRAGKRFALIADISQFYHSVYTHTLEWAVHTKTAVKNNRALPHRQRAVMWGRGLDDLHRGLQDQQSVGIPIGPDTSLVAAEVLLGRVDEEVSRHLSAPGFRYVDDYELYFDTLAQAEHALSVLQAVLTEYNLVLNPRKTKIVELPQPLSPEWTRDLRLAGRHVHGRGQRHSLIDLFDAAHVARKQWPDAPVAKYAMGIVGNVTCQSTNWEVLQALLMQAIAVEPGVIREVLKYLSMGVPAGRNVNRSMVARTLAGVISRHALLGHGSEVAWALWAHIQLGLSLDPASVAAAERMDDDVVLLVLLDAENRGLATTTNKGALAARMSAAALYSGNWLLAYEAARKGWLPHTHLASDPDFSGLAAAGVEFYQNIPAPAQTQIHVPPHGGAGSGASP
ncbi:MAG: RNA-directed DNA polymerase [Nannocystales bacterium]